MADTETLHGKLDLLVRAIEEKFLVISNHAEGMLPSFTVPNKEDDGYSVKAFPARARELTTALKIAEINYIPEDAPFGGKDRITIPYSDDTLSEKLDTALAHVKATTPAQGGPEERSR